MVKVMLAIVVTLFRPRPRIEPREKQPIAVERGAS
jgi:hypothetical protein